MTKSFKIVNAERFQVSGDSSSGRIVLAFDAPAPGVAIAITPSAAAVVLSQLSLLIAACSERAAQELLQHLAVRDVEATRTEFGVPVLRYTHENGMQATLDLQHQDAQRLRDQLTLLLESWPDQPAPN